MGIPDAIQTLSAAFSFGILLQAASGALYVHYNGHGTTILRDGRRLVLVMFLVFVVLWAGVEFINLLLPPLIPAPCQITLVFSTAFDQLARVSVEQFLVWSVGFGTKVTGGRLVLQGILFLRMLAGGVLVGFTRPDFSPACVARTSLLPVSIAVLALDVIIIAWLMIRAMALGMFRTMKDKGNSRREESKALVFSLFGLFAWFVASVPMIIGDPSLILLIRTVVPAIGLLILVGIATMYSGALTMNMVEIMTPEANSPYGPPPMAPYREISHNQAENGSPLPQTYTKSGLFVVNPSSTPRDSPRVSQSTRGFTKAADEPTITVESVGANGPDQARREPGYRGSSGIFPSPLSQSKGGTFAPQIRAAGADAAMQPGSVTTVLAAAIPVKRGFFGFTKASPPKPSVRALGISPPVMTNPDESNIQPFAKLATIDLAQAASIEKERREGAAARSRLIADRPAPQPPVTSTAEVLRTSVSVKRKEIVSRAPPFPVAPISAKANTTSAELSPGHEAVRRRSPTNTNTFKKNMDDKVAIITPLQKQSTLGLPSHPRAQQVTMGRPGKTKTVMFMNEVKYDDPATVHSIVQEAPRMYAALQEAARIRNKSHWTTTGALKSASGSVIHRPRPVKRESSRRDHRRSSSAGSLVARKTILMSSPGSPSQLPALPPPPVTSAANLKRLLQEDGKSMTFNEKIELLFPAPPSRDGSRKRRSSVPTLNVPSVYVADTPVQTPKELDFRGKRLTVANVDIHNFEESSHETTKPAEKQVSRKAEPNKQIDHYNTNTKTITDDVDAGLLVPRVSSRQVSAQPSLLDVPKRRSVTNELQKLRSLLKKDSYAPEILSQNTYKSEIIKPKQGPVLHIEAEGKHIMTMMVGSEETRESYLSAAESTMSFIFGMEQQPGQTSREPTWHRRIGDVLPTFSGRKSASSMRKMPPPVPLLLHQKKRTKDVIVRDVEPSPPPDSPNRAIEEIQKQLDRFEEPSQSSLGELLRNMPQAEDGGRSELLANLEKEMGLQEDQWNQNHANLDRHSVASFMSLRQDESLEPSPLYEEPQRVGRPTSRIESRHARNRNSMLMKQRSSYSSSTPSNSTSTAGPDNKSRAKLWQQRLANAQHEYLGNLASTNSIGMNYLSVAQTLIASPTPPDTESGTKFDSESEAEILQARSIDSALQKPVVNLWSAPVKAPKTMAGRMWNNPRQVLNVRQATAEPPAKNVRPAQRRADGVLSICTKRLWVKPRSVKRYSFNGLWGMKVASPRSVTARRTSGQPMRKSKRISFLPDILESPMPLPNKDTLGIFQFPWGETSDQPIYQPTLNPVSVTAPIVIAKSVSRDSELLGIDDYTPSFFDDYDNDEEEDEGDDVFDETTLWEIANLLNTDEIPSAMGLKPSVKSFEDYDNENGHRQTADTQSQEPAGPKIVSKLPIQPLAFSARQFPNPASASKLSNMWPPQGDNMVDNRNSLDMFTLPSEGSLIRTTKKEPAAVEMVKAPRQLTSETRRISTQDMRVGSKPERKSVEWISRSNANYTAAPTSLLLWSPPKRVPYSTPRGLFNISVVRATIRSSDFTPAAIEMTTKPRTSQVTLDKLTSTKLWSGCTNLPLERDWISESSVRPESPAFNSSESGNTTPTSDSSSNRSSLSTSTKASSLWNSGGSMRSWFDTKNSPNIPVTSPTDDPARPSKLPSRQKSTKGSPLPGIRESRVLASRDIFEVKTPMLEAPARRPRQGTIAQQQVMPVPKPLRHQHRPAVAYRSVWEAALTEAISLSKPRVQRPRCTPAMWKMALHEAIKGGSKPQYDAAILHPVFFTESMFSNVSDVHPAAIGYATKSAMWSKALASPPVQAFFKPEEFTHKPLAPQSLELPILKSSFLWDHSPHVPSPKSFAYSGMWTVQPAVKISSVITIPGSNVSGTWEADQSTAGASAPVSLFINPHNAPWHHITKNNSPEPLAKIESRNMWRPSREIPQSPKNWLLPPKQFSRVVFRY